MLTSVASKLFRTAFPHRHLHKRDRSPAPAPARTNWGVEELEPRRLFVTLVGGDVFTYVDASNVLSREQNIGNQGEIVRIRVEHLN